MNVNGSVTPQKFYFQPSASRVCELHRMLIEVDDNAAAGVDEFGAAMALTNGVLIRVIDSGENVILDLLDGEAIKSNGDWAKHCYDAQNIGINLSGDDIWTVRWSFDRAGQPLWFPVGHDYRLEVVIQDDLTSLVDFHIMVQGYYD